MSVLVEMTTTEVVEDFKDPGAVQRDGIIAGGIILIVGICGLTANLTAIRIIKTVPSLRNCFGNLLLLHATGEAGIMIIFIFWAAPISFFQLEISQTFYGLKIGYFGLFLWFVCLYVQLFKSINRLMAIASPISYRIIFADKNSKYVILAVIFLCLLHSILYFFPECDFYFDADNHIWTFAPTNCGEIMSYYIDFLFCNSFMGVILVIDGITFIFIQRGKKLINKKNKREIQFFMQACATSFVYVLELASFHLVWRLTSDPWLLFCSTSLAWELCHVIDG
uniref:7TM GPCR serpentine receptor class x (Srx) domain-containing protein n=1 Tax=Panagrolaimus sp. JU765 TaxID=591449 RepID=A0AC34RT91_9BILA